MSIATHSGCLPVENPFCSEYALESRHIVSNSTGERKAQQVSVYSTSKIIGWQIYKPTYQKELVALHKVQHEVWYKLSWPH